MVEKAGTEFLHKSDRGVDEPGLGRSKLPLCIVCAVGDHGQHRHIREYEAKVSHKAHADDLKICGKFPAHQESDGLEQDHKHTDKHSFDLAKFFQHGRHHGDDHQADPQGYQREYSF